MARDSLPDQSATPDLREVVTMLKGFVMRIEDNSRGAFSDEAAHRFLAAINEESCKMLTALDRPDLLVEVVGAARDDVPASAEWIDGYAKGRADERAAFDQIRCDCGADEGRFFTAHPSGHAVTCATRSASREKGAS